MPRLKKTSPLKQHLAIRTHALTDEEDRLLKRLSQDASDRLGWTVSSSAVIRALLRYVNAQPSAWAVDQLFPLIDEEIAAGRVWGSKPQRTKSDARERARE